MKANLDEMRIEEILSERGSIRYDGKPLQSNIGAFNIKEFILIYYGSSRDKKSRQLAGALNQFVDCFNPDDQGLEKEKMTTSDKTSGEVYMCSSKRSCQIFYVPCELNYLEFQNFYQENYEYGWIYPDFP